MSEPYRPPRCCTVCYGPATFVVHDDGFGTYACDEHVPLNPGSVPLDHWFEFVEERALAADAIWRLTGHG